MQRVPLQKKLATRITKTPAGITSVILHGTEIVSFDDKAIRLNSGGWQTVTTKRRMNQAADHFLLPITVYQSNHTWYVHIGGEVAIPFYDGMEISRDRNAPFPNERIVPGVTEQEYNGWCNRSTWNCMLWLNNTESDYRAYRAAAKREPFTAMSAKQFVLRLWGNRNSFTARTPDGEPLARVHWDSIANAMNED